MSGPLCCPKCGSVRLLDRHGICAACDVRGVEPEEAARQKAAIAIAHAAGYAEAVADVVAWLRSEMPSRSCESVGVFGYFMQALRNGVHGGFPHNPAGTEYLMIEACRNGENPPMHFKPGVR